MKRDKLIAGIRNNPHGVRFSSFVKAIMASGFEARRQKGRHMIFSHPKRGYLNIQNDKGMAKGYQVKQFLDIIGALDADGETG